MSTQQEYVFEWVSKEAPIIQQTCKYTYSVTMFRSQFGACGGWWWCGEGGGGKSCACDLHIMTRCEWLKAAKLNRAVLPAAPIRNCCCHCALHICYLLWPGSGPGSRRPAGAIPAASSSGARPHDLRARLPTSPALCFRRLCGPGGLPLLASTIGRAQNRALRPG